MIGTRNGQWRVSRRWLIVIVGCLSSTLVVEAASMSYERTVAQLTQALETSQRLAKQMLPYEAVFRRDPMQALVDEHGELVTSAGLHGGLSVQGIIWSEEHPMAVVDDELFKQGDTIGAYTILVIQPDGIVVKRKGEGALFVPLDRGIEPLGATSQQEPTSFWEDVPAPLLAKQVSLTLPTGDASGWTLTLQ